MSLCVLFCDKIKMGDTKKTKVYDTLERRNCGNACYAHKEKDGC